MIGWIKVHRKLMGKAFYSKDSEKVHLWIHILMKANHCGSEELLGGKLIRCEPGQFTTGRKQLSIETGICESKIERILNYFEKIEQQIEQQKTNLNRLISVRNWETYQNDEQQSEQQSNNNRTTIEQQLNTLKELKNIKNEKNKIYSELLNEIKPVFASKFIDEEKWLEEIRKLIEIDKYTQDEIKNAVRWARNDHFWNDNFMSLLKLRQKNKEGIKYIDVFIEKSKAKKHQPEKMDTTYQPLWTIEEQKQNF